MAAANKLTNASNDRPTRPKHKKPTGSHKLKGLSQLAPYGQGDLDHLCGIYSIINAIRVLLQPITPVSAAKSYKLFDASIEFLRHCDCLDPALVNGIDIKRWKQLAALLAEHASTAEWLIAVDTTKRRMPARAIMRCIDDSLANGSPVLLHLGRRHQHYTVVAGATPHNILLFDSWRLARAKREGFVHRHDVTASSMIRLTVQLRI